MIQNIIYISGAVVFSFAVSGGVLYLFAKTLGKMWAGRYLENVKQEHETLIVELKHKLDNLAEMQKHALQIAQLEHQIRFSKLHEKRANIIADLYERGLDLERAGSRYVVEHRRVDSPENDPEFRKLDQQLLDFYFFAERKWIYLPEHTCNLLTNLKTSITTHVGRVDLWTNLGPDPSPEDLKERKKAIMGALEAFSSEIPAIQKALIADFREMLGVESPKEQPN